MRTSRPYAKRVPAPRVFDSEPLALGNARGAVGGGLGVLGLLTSQGVNGLAALFGLALVM